MRSFVASGAVTIALLVVGCRGASKRDPPSVAPDPVVASSSAPAKPIVAAAPFHSSQTPVVLARGDDVAWIHLGDLGLVGHTIDGGAHWTWARLPPSGTSALSLARGDGSAWVTQWAEGKATTLLRCDGEKLTDVTPKTSLGGTGASALARVQPFDRDVAFVHRSDATDPEHTTIFVTHDGGKTWTTDRVSTFSPIVDVRIFALDRDHAWALVELEHGMSSMPGLLYLTDDGGKGWMTVVPPPPNAGELSFLDDRRGFLLASTTTTSPPNLWRTEDRGLSWKKVLDESDEVSGMPIFDGDDAIVVAKELHVTTDGGAHWRKGSARPDGAIGQLGGVVWRVGDDGRFAFGAGDAWTKRPADPLLVGDVESISVTSKTTGWIVLRVDQETWRVVATHDAGLHWTSFAPPEKKG